MVNRNKFFQIQILIFYPKLVKFSARCRNITSNKMRWVCKLVLLFVS